MAEASIEAGKGKVPDGPMMADVGDGTTAITLPERVDNSNVLAVLKSLEAECKARGFPWSAGVPTIWSAVSANCRTN